MFFFPFQTLLVAATVYLAFAGNLHEPAGGQESPSPNKVGVGFPPPPPPPTPPIAASSSRPDALDLRHPMRDPVTGSSDLLAVRRLPLQAVGYSIHAALADADLTNPASTGLLYVVPRHHLPRRPPRLRLPSPSLEKKKSIKYSLLRSSTLLKASTTSSPRGFRLPHLNLRSRWSYGGPFAGDVTLGPPLWCDSKAATSPSVLLDLRRVPEISDDLDDSSALHRLPATIAPTVPPVVKASSPRVTLGWVRSTCNLRALFANHASL